MAADAPPRPLVPLDPQTEEEWEALRAIAHKLLDESIDRLKAVKTGTWTAPPGSIDSTEEEPRGGAWLSSSGTWTEPPDELKGEVRAEDLNNFLKRTVLCVGPRRC